MFLGILSDPEKRIELKRLKLDNALTNEVWNEARAASHRFRPAVEDLFLKDDAKLRELTLRYGIFQAIIGDENATNRFFQRCSCQRRLRSRS